MTKLPLALAGAATSVVLALASPALAGPGGDDGGGRGGGDDRVIRTGGCTDGARWKLKVQTDDGRLEVEAEVDSNVSGQSWAWRIKDDGAVVARGTATTRGRSGSFSVERRIADGAGTDRITFRARHAGEVCSGTIAF